MGGVLAVGYLQTDQVGLNRILPQSPSRHDAIREGDFSGRVVRWACNCTACSDLQRMGAGGEVNSSTPMYRDTPEGGVSASGSLKLRSRVGLDQ
jgi:hypothetical protein